MNLKPEQVEEINSLLKRERLGFPEFRRSVNSGGANVVWLRKALKHTNAGSPRLRELLDLD